MSNGAHHRGGLLLAGGALCAVVVLACGLIAPNVAAAGWLVGFVFWSSVAVGSLLLMMIHRLTGGRWGLALRPTLEPLAATIPLLFLLIVPVFLAIPLLYPWSGGTGVVKPDVLTGYLNVPWFIGRSLIALAGWSVLAMLLARTDGQRGMLLAALGLTFHCVVIGPIGFDWILSVAPPFASSSFGASLAVTQLIAALAFVLALPFPLPEGERVASEASRVRGSVTIDSERPTPQPSTLRGEGAQALELVAGDLGGLLLACTLGITYIDFMAVLVIWYGDVPRTVAWFVARDHLPWTALAVAAFLLVSLIPFGVLILARVRRSRAALRIVAAGVIVGLFCYDTYLVAPSFGAGTVLSALLATMAIGLLLAALLTWPCRLALTRGRPAYGE